MLGCSLLRQRANRVRCDGVVRQGEGECLRQDGPGTDSLGFGQAVEELRNAPRGGLNERDLADTRADEAVDGLLVVVDRLGQDLPGLRCDPGGA